MTLPGGGLERRARNRHRPQERRHKPMRVARQVPVILDTLEVARRDVGVAQRARPGSRSSKMPKNRSPTLPRPRAKSPNRPSARTSLPTQRSIFPARPNGMRSLSAAKLSASAARRPAQTSRWFTGKTLPTPTTQPPKNASTQSENFRPRTPRSGRGTPPPLSRTWRRYVMLPGTNETRPP